MKGCLGSETSFCRVSFLCWLLLIPFISFFFFFFFPLYLGSSIHSPNSMGPDKDVKASKDDAMKKEIKAEG